MAYALVCSVALVVSILTFFSGFGLGTLLMPVFAVFFPLEIAIGATAAVHLANNLFKVALVGKDAHWPTVLAYGIPAALASVAGAEALVYAGRLPPLATYQLGGTTHSTTIVGVVVAVVIACFACLELWSRFDRLAFDRRWVPVGGVISGFFGGLSGHQGALRTAFLARSGLSRDAFIGTRVVGAVIVDVPRLAVYAFALRGAEMEVLRSRGGVGLVVAASLAAFAGSFIGSRAVKKVSMTALHRVVGAALIVMAVALGAGLI